MSTDYAAFLEAKASKPPASGIEPGDLHPSLFDFQRAIVQWAVRRGRAALFEDTGLGKSRQQIEWLRSILAGVGEGASGLILAPLGVVEQTIEEAASIGVEVRFAETHPGPGYQGIYITNYEKLHKFDPERWDGLVCDESSILKSLDGATRTRLLEDWTAVPYRLACTATPAPNDITELANHAEFLGIMSRAEMLATFFVHEADQGAGWRLKGHAVDSFYRWMASWAMYIRRPSDLGFSDEGFILPPLNIEQMTVSVGIVPDGELFPALMPGIQGRLIARRQSMSARVEAASKLIKESPGQWLVWCGLNDEQDAMAAELGADCISIQGSTKNKVELYRQWKAGNVRVLISKLAIFGFGLNMQNAHQMLFLGMGDSFESYYQGIRREWRFGQQSPVEVKIVVSEVEGRVVENVRAKEREHETLSAGVIEHVRAFEQAEITGASRDQDEYRTSEAEGSDWKMMLGDSVERIAEIETGSVGLSVYSPPFASLYTYSDSDRDLGNSRSYEQFFEHYRLIVREVARVTMPCRRTCVHVQQVALKKVIDGVIGWRDFRADVVRLHVEEGWIYDGEVVIDKDPQAAAIRTRSKSLTFMQKNKDSAWSHPCMADYILLFRAPGENPEPVQTDVNNEEWIQWARPIWYGIRETETLQAASAREDKDEKHICPLQLETILRCVRLWSNKGDLVLDPFAGIGSTGYVACKNDRRFVGIELKSSYYRQAVANLHASHAQMSIFETLEAGT